MKNYGIYGEFYYEIVDEKTLTVDLCSKKKKNLILDQGLDLLSQYSFVDSVAYCAVSSNSTAPLSTDTGLIDEFARTNVLDVSVENYAITQVDDYAQTYQFTRVFMFPTSLNPTNYGTIGWSYSPTPGQNLFSKSLVLDVNGNPGPVFVPKGKYLRVYYTIFLTLNPGFSYGTSNIPDIGPDTGFYSLQYIGLKCVNPDGTVGYWDAGADSNELYSISEIFLSTDTDGLYYPLGGSVDRSAYNNYTAQTINTYLGNGTMQKTAGFGKNKAVDNIQSFGTGPIGSSYINNGYVFLLDVTLVKSPNLNFAPVFIYSVTRT